MEVIIRTIPHRKQRYNTVGDWIWDGQTLHIYVSDLQNEGYEFLIALHEYFEAFKCTQKNITMDQVDSFDTSFLGSGEPGDSSLAPYYQEHQEATCLERTSCQFLNLNWQDYDNAVTNLGSGENHVNETSS